MKQRFARHAEYIRCHAEYIRCHAEYIRCHAELVSASMTNLRKFIVAALLLLLSLFVISCDNAFSDIIEDSIQEPSKTEALSPYLVLTVEEASSRNVLTPIPDPSSRPVVSIISPSLFSDISLSGTRTEGGTISVSAANFTELAQRRIYLEEGSWTFNLVAYCGKTEASAGGKYTATQSINVVSGANPLTMTLAPAPLAQSTEAERMGSWQASLEFPADTIDLIRVKVYNYSTFAAGITASSPAVQTLPDFVKGAAYDGTGNQTVTTNESSLSMGSYVIYIEYFTQITYENAAPELQLLNTWAELLRINPGAKSEGSITLPVADPVYTITYDLGGANWETSSTEVIPSSYTRNSGTSGVITLPTEAAFVNRNPASFAPDASNRPYQLLGWYDNPEFSGSPILSFNVSDAQNKSFYAKWKEPVYDIYVQDGADDSVADGSRAHPFSSVTLDTYRAFDDITGVVKDENDNIIAYKSTIHILSDFANITTPWGTGDEEHDLDGMCVNFVGEKDGVANADVTLTANVPSEQSFVRIVNAQKMKFSHVNITSSTGHVNGYGCLSVVSGVLHFEDSSIKGYTAKGCCGINAEGVVYLKNCEITDNFAIDKDDDPAKIWGCAVNVGTGSLYVSGRVKIQNNKILNNDSTHTDTGLKWNVFIGTDVNGTSIFHPIKFLAPLTSGSRIGVKLAQEPQTFTQLFSSKMGSEANPADYFFSDSGYEVRLDSGEARLAIVQTLYVSSISASPAGDDTNGNGTEAHPFASISKAIERITSFNDNQIDAVIKVKGEVLCNTEITNTSLIAKTLKIEGEGDGAVLNGDSATLLGSTPPTDHTVNGTILNLCSNVPVTIKNLTLKNGRTTGNGGAVYVDGANLTIENVIITTNFASYGGAVAIVNSGTLTMNGGSISGNGALRQGGGVYVGSSATFNMSGEDALIESNVIMGIRTSTGSVTPDTKTAGGGVCIASGGTFTMDNGTIQKNAAQTGGAICVMGTFNFNDGTITSNKKGSGGSDVDPATRSIEQLITLRDSKLNNYNYAANVELGLPGTFNMNGGTITSTLTDSHGNYVAGQNGAGVCIYGAGADGDTAGTATFNMTGGSITGLKIGQSAAIYINIMVTGASGVFNMSGGSITNNIYDSSVGGSGGNGGAVCLQDNGQFIMTGGEISGNHTNYHGGAVYISDSSSTITLGESGDTSTIVIKDNTAGTSNAVDNIYLQSGRTIVIAGALDTESEIGIKRSVGFTSEPFTNGYASTNSGTAPDQIFTSDDGYRIIAGTGGEAAFGASSGGLYMPGDYNFTFTASRNKVVVGHDADVTITPTVKRTEASGAEIDLFYNPADHKLYVDSLYTLPAGGDNEVTWEASLWCGSEVEQDPLAAVDTDSNANKFTIAALDYPDTYTLRVRATYMGYTHDASFTVQCKALGPVPEGFVAVIGATITDAVSGSYVFTTGRTLTIPYLYVCDHEVTQAEFTDIMGTNPSEFNGSSGKEAATGEVQENRPVEYVNWYAAIAYCNKRSLAEGLTPCYTVSGITDWTNRAYSSIPTSSNSTWDGATCDFTANGYRLPTEVEWEYIARGGDGGIPATQTTYSGSSSIGSVAWYESNSESKTHEVKKKTANTLGIYDMSGNVWEWCWDMYSTISSSTPATGPSSGSFRVPRGGSWSHYGSSCSVYNRDNFSPSYRNNNLGFRVVRTAD